MPMEIVATVLLHGATARNRTYLMDLFIYVLFFSIFTTHSIVVVS